MIKTVFNTLFSKILSAVFSLGVVILTSQVLGPEGRGEISLLSADIGIILLFSQIVGGASLVYLYSRANPFHLVLASLAWSIISPAVLVPIMHTLGLIEHGYALHLMFLCMLFGISSSFHMLILGAEKITLYNTLQLMLTLVICASLSVLFFVFQRQTTYSYVSSLYVSYALSVFLSILASHGVLKNFSLTGWKTTVKQAFTRGFTVQFSNIIQFFNYRLSYFFLSKYMTSLGIFSISLVLAEAVWLIGNSISLVHFSNVANEKNRDNSIQQSFLFAKISFWATAACVTVLAASPAGLYAFFFGDKFGPTKMATLALCPGILAIGFGMVFSHYFAGTGRFKINNIAALLGLAVKIPACILLVPTFREEGAGWACTLSYCTSFLFLYLKFAKETGFGLRDLIITQNERASIIALLKTKTKLT